MTTDDRSSETDAVFAARLAVIEARESVDVAADVAVEAVARAICDGDAKDHGTYTWGEAGRELRDDYRRAARHALTAMPPVDETLREFDRSEAHNVGMQAVREMAFDWYCPRSEPGRTRRDCPECVAEVALDAALDVIGGMS